MLYLRRKYAVRYEYAMYPDSHIDVETQDCLFEDHAIVQPSIIRISSVGGVGVPAEGIERGGFLYLYLDPEIF